MSSAKASSRKKLQKKVFDVGLLLLLAAILVAVGLMSGIVGMRLAVRQSEIVVPSIVGRSVDEATERLSVRELDLQVIGERYDPNSEAGQVVAQFPLAGGRMKARRPVQVIVSLGARTHAVPDFVGSTAQVARLTAAQYNYEIGHISRIPWEGIEKDIVIQQDPPAGSTETTSPKVNLLVSDGEAGDFVMPDLTGRNLNEVEPFLTDQGFEVGSIVYRFYANVVKGTVVNHFPRPGYLVTVEDTINLEVAR